MERLDTQHLPSEVTISNADAQEKLLLIERKEFIKDQIDHYKSQIALIEKEV